MNDTDNIEPKIEQPSEEEIADAMKEIQEKNGVTLSEADAARYLSLRSELGWWMDIEQDGTTDQLVTNEMANELQAHVRQQSGEEITLEEASKRAQASLEASAGTEKERLAREIRKIISSDSK